MHTIATVTWLTFQEARRRRVALAAIVLALLFVVLYGVGLKLVSDEVQRSSRLPSAVVRTQLHSFLLTAGLYVTHFLTVMLAIFASVDTVSGEISSHTIQTIVTKPVRRWHVLLGKWLGYALMLCAYLFVLAGGIVAITWLLVGYSPPNALPGLTLLLLEALVLLSLSMLGGTRLSTLANGVLLFMLYGLTFIGSWVEQIGSLLQSQVAVRIGVLSSLLLPVEALWRRASYLMQPSLARQIPSPFSSSSVPSEAMVVYAVGYGLLMLVIAMRVFGRRDL